MKRLLERLTQDLNDFPSDPTLTAHRVPLPKDPEWMKETLAWLDQYMSEKRTDRDFFDLYHSWHSEVYFENVSDFRVFFVEVRRKIAERLDDFNAKDAKRRRNRVPKAN
ncbi:hypothetical protein WDZ92_40945 [Nostoc sp. NIES-2111]